MKILIVIFLLVVSSQSPPPSPYEEYYYMDARVYDNYGPSVTEWGGSCICPSGEIFYVGAISGTNCGSIACFNGNQGPCQKQAGPWSYRRVECGDKVRNRGYKRPSDLITWTESDDL